MKILVTGSTGLIGSALVSFLTTGGHEVTRLVRSESKRTTDSIPVLVWDPASGKVDAAGLEALDGVIHLAGESIAAARWTTAQKSRIVESRVKGTRLLAETLAKLSLPPKVLICSSAIGYYGNRGDEELIEGSSSGSDFLSRVCCEWEAAASPALKKGIRVVHLRTGIVLSPKGGALAKMLLPFQLGVGGVIGNGRQFMSWIALDDVVGACHYVLLNDSLRGPVNAVAPNPVTNQVFTKTMGKVLRRPTVFPLPAFAARLGFGEMADALLLSSARVVPRKLQDSGYHFRFSDLENALRHILGK